MRHTCGKGVGEGRRERGDDAGADSCAGTAAQHLRAAVGRVEYEAHGGSEEVLVHGYYLRVREGRQRVCGGARARVREAPSAPLHPRAGAPASMPPDGAPGRRSADRMRPVGSAAHMVNMDRCSRAVMTPGPLGLRGE